MIIGSFGKILILLAGLTALNRLFPSVRFDLQTRRLYTLFFHCQREQYVALQQLTRARYQIVRQTTQEKQRFLQYLSYKCNTFTEEVESSVFGKAMMDLFLESYSLDELSSMPLEELADYLRTKGKNRFPDPEYVAESIQKAVRSSYRLDKVVEDSIDTILGTSITLIRTFEKQIKELDKSIERIMKG